jgi:hypothetical protein
LKFLGAGHESVPHVLLAGEEYAVTTLKVTVKHHSIDPLARSLHPDGLVGSLAGDRINRAMGTARLL